MRHASPMVQKIKRKIQVICRLTRRNIGDKIEKYSHKFKHEQIDKNLHLFIFTPKYNLRAEENVVHDSFDRRSVRHGVGGPFKIHHQVMMVIAASEARL